MTQDEIDALFGATEAKPPAAPASSSQSGEKRIEDLFAEGSKEEPPTVTSTAVAPFAGFNKAFPHALGWPVDLVNWGMKKAGLPVSETPVGGSEFFKKAMPPEIEPKGKLERALQAGGEGIAYALAPEAALRATAPKIIGEVAKSPAGVTARETLEHMFGAKAPPTKSAMAENVAVNLGAGTGAEAASELVPDRWKAIAGMAGGVGGGGLAQLGVGASKTIPVMARGVSDYFQPIFNPEKEASRKFAGSTTSPMRALDIIENEPQELIRGSKPTTFELTGDTGIGQQQRQAETRTPNAFLERRGEQAQARQAALEGVAPEGSPMEVPKLIRQQLDAVTASEEQAARQAEERAKAAIDQMGGTGTPEDYGRLLRQYTQEAKDTANAARRKLYDAVDPEGSLNVVAQGVRDTAGKIAEEASSDLAKPLEGELAAIVRDAGNAADVVTFKSLRGLDTRISDAMRTELRNNGETNTYRQLSQMKESVLDAINNAVENQARYEADAVRTGAISAEDSMFERMRGLWGITGGAKPKPTPPALEPNLTPEAVANLEAAKQAHKDYAGTFREGSVGEVLRPGQSKGQYKLAFDANVGPKFFRAGDTGYEAGQQFLKAAGDNRQALETMSDYIISRAFNESRDPATGLVDPKKFDAWKRRYESALRSFPEVEARLSSAANVSKSALDVAAKSRATIEAAQNSEVAKLVGAQDPETVVKSVGNVFGQKNAPTVMRNLAQAAAGNPDAKAGLQRAVADYIRQRFISTAEAGTSEAKLINSASFQKFVRDNRRTLEQVLDKDQINTMQALADDLNRNARSVSGSALAGRPTTAQDVSPMMAKGKSYWDNIVRGAGAVVAPIVGAGATGAAAGPMAGLTAFGAIVGAEILGGMRAAGMQKAEQLITEALLNPELARQLLKNAPAKANAPVNRSLSETIANIGTTGARQPLQGNSNQDEEVPPLTIHGPGNRTGRASGGAVNLMALSKAAKKQVTKSTEDLLNVDDSTVTRALDIANQHI